MWTCILNSHYYHHYYLPRSLTASSLLYIFGPAAAWPGPRRGSCLSDPVGPQAACTCTLGRRVRPARAGRGATARAPPAANAAATRHGERHAPASSSPSPDLDILPGVQRPLGGESTDRRFLGASSILPRSACEPAGHRAQHCRSAPRRQPQGAGPPCSVIKQRMTRSAPRGHGRDMHGVMGGSGATHARLGRWWWLRRDEEGCLARRTPAQPGGVAQWAERGAAPAPCERRPSHVALAGSVPPAGRPRPDESLGWGVQPPRPPSRTCSPRSDRKA